MLKDYCDGQSVAYNILNNAINNKTIAHAYLFVADNINEASTFAFSFAKTLLCPNNKFDNNDCGACSICRRIDNGNFPELTIIEPDGLWIKKNQLLELQQKFRTKALEGDKKVYIINQVDKLNVQSANSILKFLEEPEPDIIALLTTTDVHGVLETIISRCQVISLKGNISNNQSIIDNENISNKTFLKIANLFYKNREEFNNFIEDEKNIRKLEAIIMFVKKYEVLHKDVLLEINRLLNDNFKDKSDYIFAFEIMILFYKDVLNVMYNKNLEIFTYYTEVVDFVVSYNKKSDIIHKMQVIIFMKEKIKYNLNLNLLMDRLIIEMESGVHA